MSDTEVKIFFNFRSPYCYPVVQKMFLQLTDYDIAVAWRSLGGWDGRSPPERAKVKIPLTPQDGSRWCKPLNIPFNPPPMTTDPNPAALLAFVAEQHGVLEAYVKSIMWAEWAEGQDIGQTDVLNAVAQPLGITTDQVEAALNDAALQARLAANWSEAIELGVIGVPTFVVGEQIFWGNDRFDFLLEHLDELGCKT